jgi:hypothetical protein
MLVKDWNWFIKALALAFIAYWLHLGQRLPDWLGSYGFHLPTSASTIFAPLPSPFPVILWSVTLAGGLLLFFSKTVLWGSLLAGAGFFYATMCDVASRGALNMHFLFAFALIFWSAGLGRIGKTIMSAWPTYLIRIYVVMVYFGAGWRKVVYGNWLDKPDTLFICSMGYYTTNATRWLYSNAPFFTWTLLQYTTVAFELGAPLLFLYPPFRKIGVIAGCLLHFGIAVLMRDLYYFSLQMITFYIPILIRIFPE